MMSYLTFTFTECQTAQAAQIWYQNVHSNLLKKLCDEIRVRVDCAVIEIKRFTETNCTKKKKKKNFIYKSSRL